MASLRDIRKRIRSVKSTQKITRALKLVSAAKLRRAQSAIVQARPYAQSLKDIITSIAQRNTDQELSHRLLEQRTDIKRAMVIVLTSDRGMCGGFNGNAIRRAERFVAEQKSHIEIVELGTVGKRGQDYFLGKRAQIRQGYNYIFSDLQFQEAKSIAIRVADEFIQKELDAVYFVYNKFQSAMTQIVTVDQLLPIAIGEKSQMTQDFVYEPNRITLLDKLLPRYLATQVWRTLLESIAAEHGARMTAMESATKNASDMIGSLTLSYNRVRQAGITKELMEIVSGSEAQKGK